MIRARWTINDALMRVELRVADLDRRLVLARNPAAVGAFWWESFTEGEELLPILAVDAEHGATEILEAARLALPDPAWKARYEELHEHHEREVGRVDALLELALHPLREVR